MSLFQSLFTENHLFLAWEHVKAKHAAGGIDGLSVSDFEKNIFKNLHLLQEELIHKKWNPEPYLRIEIKKNESEKRKLGLLSIKDKIVQQAILNLIEDRFEKLFLNHSYAYRKGKGHLKAVRRTMNELNIQKEGFILKLDIDDYFDTINHQILFTRLKTMIEDREIVRLIELSVKMGVVSKKLKWNEIKQGIPQGAILSPLLSNFYLHPFDQFVTSKTNSYIRYADDFLIICKTEEEIKKILESITSFLNNKLKLKLNTPVIKTFNEGVDFLGVTISKNKIEITPEKKEKLKNRILQIEFQNGTFTSKSIESMEGIKRYYAQLLHQDTLLTFDQMLQEKIKTLILEHCSEISNKKTLIESLKKIPSFSLQAESNQKQFFQDYVSYYSECKKNKELKLNELDNLKLIRKKKLEYQKKEGENSELVISTIGCFIGKSKQGITVKQNGKNILKKSTASLEHITVFARGVSISSDAIFYCMNQDIPIDFFDQKGQLYASIISPISIENSLWKQQTELTLEQRCYLAKQIISGKIRNQFNLVKYFYKYHKDESSISASYAQMCHQSKELLKKISDLKTDEIDYAEKLMGYEAQTAILYWDFIRQLLIDDNIEFEERVRKGADDLVNSLLNYGYSLIYPRIWQALLAQHLNPTVGIIHCYQENKPTLAYDLIEIFRSQAVDRVIVSMLQKGESLKMDRSLLQEDSKKRLIKNIFERLNRYENYRGENIKFSQIIMKQAKELAQYIKGEKKSYKPYIAKW